MTIRLPKWIKGVALPAALSTIVPTDASPSVSQLPPGLFSKSQLSLPMHELSLGNFTSNTLKLTSAPSVTATEIRISPEEKRLEQKDEKRFSALAVKEALGTITPQEMEDLEGLDHRRLVDQPVSDAKAIEARERLLFKIESLISELNSFGKHRRGKS